MQPAILRFGTQSLGQMIAVVGYSYRSAQVLRCKTGSKMTFLIPWSTITMVITP